jgi:hypothetical protein
MSDPRLQAAFKLLGGIALGSSIQGKISSDLQVLVNTLKEGRSGASSSQVHERKEIKSRICGFDPKCSRAYQAIEAKGFGHLNFTELLSMGLVMAQHANLAIDRQAKRRKIVFFKWLDDHWDVLEPHLARIQKGESTVP